MRFSWKITGIGLILAAGMLRASYWQWQRHLEKTAYIEQLSARLEVAPVPLQQLLGQLQDPDDIVHRRVLISGEYDFNHEMILRNRRLNNDPGAHVITPLHISGSDLWILVDRGFIPLNAIDQKERSQFHTPQTSSFVGLVKAGEYRKLFAPADPPAGAQYPWVDAWLRVDIPEIQKQLPFPVLPFFIEIMNGDPEQAVSDIVQSSAGREELLMLQPRGNLITTGGMKEGVDYPVPSFSTVIPPGRHFGYVFEWATMAVVTLLICLALQLRRGGIKRPL